MHLVTDMVESSACEGAGRANHAATALLLASLPIAIDDEPASNADVSNLAAADDVRHAIRNALFS